MLAGWLSEVSSGEDLEPRLLRLPDGHVLPLPVARWAGPVDAADESLLARAARPVLDIGCGPGRLTAALHARGVDVLGLELVEQIPVRVCRARELLCPQGQVLCELHPGAEATAGQVCLEGLGTSSTWFSWALLGRSALPIAAAAAGLTVPESWSAQGRDVATLLPV